MKTKDLLLSLFVILGFGFFAAYTMAVPSTVVVFPPGCELVDVTVLYDEFRDSPGTTDFDSLVGCDFVAVADMTLNVSAFGSIEWIPAVNLFSDLEDIDGQLTIDLDMHVEIGDGSIFIDSEYYDSLAFDGVDADLTFYTVPGFDNPRILRNGAVCGAPNCVILSYDSGTGVLVFETSALTDSEASTFTVEETPDSEPPGGDDDDGGGGGGGGATPAYEIVPDLIELEIKQGDSVIQLIEVQNTGTAHLIFDVEVIGVGEFTALNETSFSLPATRNRTIETFFSVDEDEPLGVRTGSIAFDTFQLDKSANVILEIVEKDPLFDLILELEDVTLVKFQKLETLVSIIQLVELGEIEVFVEYFVKDFEDSEIKLGQEVISFDGEIDIVRTFDIPSELDLGEYVLYAKLTYQNNIVTAASTFTLIDILIYLKILIALLLLAILLLILYFIMVYYDADVQKIIGLIKKGYRSLLLNRIDNAKKRYEVARKIYATLPRTHKLFIRPYCLKYYRKLRKRIAGSGKKILPSQRVSTVWSLKLPQFGQPGVSKK